MQKPCSHEQSFCAAISLFVVCLYVFVTPSFLCFGSLGLFLSLMLCGKLLILGIAFS